MHTSSAGQQLRLHSLTAFLSVVLFPGCFEPAVMERGGSPGADLGAHDESRATAPAPGDPVAPAEPAVDRATEIATDGAAGPAAPAPADGDASASPSPAEAAVPGLPPTGGGPARSLGYIGCSMTRNVALGYQALNGQRLWPPYDIGGGAIGAWASATSEYWAKFDAMVSQHGKPKAVWIQVCTFKSGVKYADLLAAVQIARNKAEPGAPIYVGGQPVYEQNWVCGIAGPDGPQWTLDLAQQAATDPATGVLADMSPMGPLNKSTTVDGCHANAEGQKLLGQQALSFFK